MPKILCDTCGRLEVFSWRRWLGSIICAGSLTGCFLTEPDDLLDVAVRLPDSVATAGVQFAFQVHVVNRASHEIVVEGGTCPPHFLVLDSEGRTVRHPSVLC